MPYKDKEKQRAYWRSWYKKNSSRVIPKVKIRRDELKAWYRNLKSKLQCSRCSENFPACLEFHHKSNDKIMQISEMCRRGHSKDRIVKEIDKCDVLCVNCHRKEHRSDFQTGFGKRVDENLLALKSMEQIRQINARRKRSDFLWELKKQRTCKYCQEKDPICLVFHHKVPTDKSFELSYLAFQKASWKRIQSELEKCVVVCANCHRKLHYSH